MDQELLEKLVDNCKKDPSKLEIVILRARESGVVIASPDETLIFQAKMVTTLKTAACRLVLEAHLQLASITQPSEVEKIKLAFIKELAKLR